MAEAATAPAPATESRMPGVTTPAPNLSAKIASALSEGGITDDGDAPEDKPETETTKETPEAETETKAEPEEPKPEPKTKRAKEWAQLEKVKAQLAKEIRDHKREKAETLKQKAELADLLKSQKELQELLEKDPAEYVKRATKGDLKGLFKKALEAPEVTPEQREMAELKEQLAEIRKWREDREKNESEREQKAREQSERQSAESTRREHVGKILNVIESNPAAAQLKGIPKQLRFVVADMARQRIISEYDRTGHEMNILDVLRSIQGELYQQQAPETESPTRETGAVETANPEAKRAPAALKTATVTSRVSGARTLSMDEKIRQAAATLKAR